MAVLTAPIGRLLYGIVDIRIRHVRLFKLRPLVYHFYLVSLGVIYIKEFANEHSEFFQKPINNLEWANVMVSGG
jgi:hypothetical protein